MGYVGCFYSIGLAWRATDWFVRPDYPRDRPARFSPLHPLVAGGQLLNLRRTTNVQATDIGRLFLNSTTNEMKQWNEDETLRPLQFTFLKLKSTWQKSLSTLNIRVIHTVDTNVPQIAQKINLFCIHDLLTYSIVRIYVDIFTHITFILLWNKHRCEKANK